VTDIVTVQAVIITWPTYLL